MFTKSKTFCSQMKANSAQLTLACLIEQRGVVYLWPSRTADTILALMEY